MTELDDTCDAPFDACHLPVAFGDELAAVLGPIPEGVAADPTGALAEARLVFGEQISELAAELAVELAAAPTHERSLVALTEHGQQHTVRAGEVLEVGRHGQVVVDHPLVSRKHLVLEHDEAGMRCRDLASANGTWLLRGGERTRIDSSGVPVVAGDVIVTVDDVALIRLDEEPIS